MTSRILKTTLAGLFIAAMVPLPFAAPAQAAGQVSLSYAPTDPAKAQALGMGLKMFSVVKGMSAGGGNVSQNGFGNMAGILQNGSGNHGLIVQEGNGHQGTVVQNGNNNNCGLFQFGQNTNAQCVQNGNGQSGATMVFGF